ncbi:flavodoxin [Haloimpatiens sp. FM7330]|uniref:flavodoxin n=1 Tax=Haloimpatiens sp. FM7330 TaxID=3298610 RepID=UPI0036440668
MKNISIIYWSGTGNTEKMALSVADGAKETGVEVQLKNVSEATIEDIKSSDAIALGCPSMGSEQLEEMEMEPFIDSISGEVNGKKVGLFGSYGWGDGQWMRDWVERMEEYGAEIIGEGVIANEEPGEDEIEQCQELGKDLTK